MRSHPWQRLLLLRARLRSSPHVIFPTHYTQVHSQPNSLPSLTSLFHTHTLRPKLQSLHPIFNYPPNPKTQISRSLSSKPELETKDNPDYGAIAKIFGSSRAVDDEIRKELELNNVAISHEYCIGALKSLESSPDVSKRFFGWVELNEGERLSSKSYNTMLCTLGVNGCVEEFWGLVDAMKKKKGYGVMRWVHDKVLKKFEEDGLDGDAVKLKNLFYSGSIGEDSMKKGCSRVCKIVKNEVWSDEVEKQILGMKVVFTSDVVKTVVESLGLEPTKALIFFRWVEEAGMLKHDQETYNAITRVLGREDCLDRFWKVIGDMKGNGCELELETYVKVLGRFCKRKLINDAVDLYEFAMAGMNKPSMECCTFLLKKIVVGKELDMDLFSKVVSVYTESGNALTDSMLNAVLKSLNSVGRHREYNKVFKAMKEGGLVASSGLQSKIAFRLGSAHKDDEASNFINVMQVSNTDPDFKAWSSLIEGYCVAGDLDKASGCFLKMIEREGIAYAGSACELIVDAYCRRNRATDAYKFLSYMVSKRQLKPWQTTYKLLIGKLLAQGEFKDALYILGLMKNDGFPPFIDPFIKHVSQFGSGDDAIAFLKAMAAKEFPSTIVFFHVFEAYFKAGRRSEAQDFLSQCPGFIRNHPDVLNMFCPVKSGGAATPTVVAA